MENTPLLSCVSPYFNSSVATNNTRICLNRALPADVTTLDTSDVCERETSLISQMVKLTGRLSSDALMGWAHSKNTGSVNHLYKIRKVTGVLNVVKIKGGYFCVVFPFQLDRELSHFTIKVNESPTSSCHVGFGKKSLFIHPVFCRD